MHLRLSRDAEKPLREHFEELAARGTGLLFLLSIATVFWWSQIDPLLEGWLSALPSSAREGSVTIYDPHGWMATRWSMIALMALITTLPFAIQQLLSFSREGLLPSERKWVRNVTVGGGGLGLIAAAYWWIWGYPFAIASAGDIGGIDGINPSYDAVLLFEVGIGISWWIFLSITALIGLTLARLYSLINGDTIDSFRIRVHGTILFLWWLVSPSALDGVWFTLSILLVLLPEIAIRWAPESILSDSARAPTSIFDSEGALHRKLFAMCHCEGACPTVPSSTIPSNLGLVETQALCLDPEARDALLDKVLRHEVSDLIISGCNGLPLPMDFRQSVQSRNCKLSGLNWLDSPSQVQDRESALSELVFSTID
ncbi:MAG: hypothetical protein CMB52_02555 [Euryarchaeota archaeon]|nr:hypothetical protein [Euryarchaeota archaeon]|tara:strand:- start:1349 stop:2458 length:1110 start_codon:yes stop_codon:yes gene_type:complete